MLTHPTQLQQTIDKETITKINEDYLRKHTVDIDIPILQNSSLPELFKYQFQLFILISNFDPFMINLDDQQMKKKDLLYIQMD